MADVTFVRGYGFPRGSQMDYAGLRGFGHYPAGRRAGGVYRTADGCPMDSVRVGNQCVPFAQVSGGADLSGFAGAGGDCGCGCNGAVGGCGGGKQMSGFGRYGRNRTVRMSEPGTYATIPPLDGYNETEGAMLQVDPLEVTIAAHDRVLPTYDFNTKRWYDEAGNEVDPSTGQILSKAGVGGLAVLGLGLLAAAFFWR